VLLANARIRSSPVHRPPAHRGDRDSPVLWGVLGTTEDVGLQRDLLRASTTRCRAEQGCRAAKAVPGCSTSAPGVRTRRCARKPCSCWCCLGIATRSPRCAPRRRMRRRTKQPGGRPADLGRGQGAGPPPAAARVGRRPPDARSCDPALAAYSDRRRRADPAHYVSLTEAEKSDAIATLASRPAYAVAMLDAMERGQVPRRDLSAFTAGNCWDSRTRTLPRSSTRSGARSAPPPKTNPNCWPATWPWCRPMRSRRPTA